MKINDSNSMKYPYMLPQGIRLASFRIDQSKRFVMRHWVNKTEHSGFRATPDVTEQKLATQ